MGLLEVTRFGLREQVSTSVKTEVVDAKLSGGKEVFIEEDWNVI